MKKGRAAVAAGVLMSAVITAGTSAASAHELPDLRPAIPALITQGDELIGQGVFCTVGYVDAAARQSFVAAHCGEDGDRVGFTDSNGNSFHEVGTLHRSAAYSAGAAANDYAVIDWDDHVIMGQNIFSGDTRLTAAEVGEGDTICFQGQTSHGYSGSYTCGAYRDRLGNNVFYFVSPGVQSGDSGGPTWVPGKGFLGVTTNTLTRPVNKDPEGMVEITTIPADGPPFNTLINSVVGGQALASKMSSDDPYNPEAEQASSYRYGESISRMMDNGSSFGFAAQYSFGGQIAIFVTLGLLLGVGVLAAIVAAVWEPALAALAQLPGFDELVNAVPGLAQFMQ